MQYDGFYCCCLFLVVSASFDVVLVVFFGGTSVGSFGLTPLCSPKLVVTPFCAKIFSLCVLSYYITGMFHWPHILIHGGKVCLIL